MEGEAEAFLRRVDEVTGRVESILRGRDARPEESKLDSLDSKW
jgi:hypothetical protein